MHVTAEIWLITIGVLVAVLAVDLLVIGRRPHEPSMREAGIAIGVFSGLAGCSGSGSGGWRAPGTPRSSSPAGSPSTA